MLDNEKATEQVQDYEEEKIVTSNEEVWFVEPFTHAEVESKPKVTKKIKKATQSQHVLKPMHINKPVQDLALEYNHSNDSYNDCFESDIDFNEELDPWTPMHEEEIILVGSKSHEGIVEQAPVIIKPVVQFIIDNSNFTKIHTL